MNYYQAKPNKPFHLSVAAIIIDDNNEVLCQHYNQLNSWNNIYWLMHSTVNPYETLEQALSRGLAEENGISAKVITFIGVKDYKSNWFGEINQETEVTKSIAYFIVKYLGEDKSLINIENPGSKSNLEKLSISEAKQKMKSQALKYNNLELDESGMLERAEKYLENYTEESFSELA